LEAAVGSNDLFISCHVLGSVDAMLQFIHAVSSLKLAVVLVPVHACTQQIMLVFICGMYPRSIFVVPSCIHVGWCLYALEPGVGHHGDRGTTAAAMLCAWFYVKIHLPATISFIAHKSRAKSYIV
jgi:hypothetical protein